MASLASRGSTVERVATNADAHRGHAGSLGHGSHLGDLPLARLTLDACRDVFAVRPDHSGRNRVDAHPRDGWTRLGEGGEFPDRGFLGGGGVARHAFRGRRERHQIPRLRICVARSALEIQGQVYLVAIRDGLRRRGVLGRIVRHLFLGVRDSCRLLRFYNSSREEQRRGQYR